MHSNARPSETVTLLATIDPQTCAPTGDPVEPVTVTSGWVPVATHLQFMAVINVGAIDTGATVDAKLEQATDASGTGTKAIAGKAITQLVAGSKQALVNLRQQDLDVNGGFGHVRLSLTVGVASAAVAAQLLGLNAKLAPATQATSVAQAV